MTGRHRRRWRRRSSTALLAVLALVVAGVVAGVRLGVDQVAGKQCASEVRLSLAVAPDIAPAVQTTTAEWLAGSPDVDGVCVAVDVRSTDPAEVAAALSAQQQVSLTGVGVPRAGAAAPDAWIPDAGSWLQRLKSAGPGFSFTEEGSVASSPVVIAMPEPVAKGLGWPGRKLTYPDLLRVLTTSTTIRPGTVDPTRDSAALSGLLALGAAAAVADQTRPGTSQGIVRALATDMSALREDLLSQLPQADDGASLAGGLGLAAMSEHDVITFNASSPAVPLVGLYLEPAAAPLDFPFAVLPDSSPLQAEAAHQVYEMLAGSKVFQDRLAVAGIRAADGSAPTGFTAPVGAPSVARAPAGAGSGTAAADKADDAAIGRALAGWSAVVAPARMLAVVDASDSMKTKVATSRGATRMALTLAAARGGLALFSDDWQVGLWISAAGLPGGGNHQELVPIGPLTSTRDDVSRALGTIRPKGGDAGLYQTILDGYLQVQRGWQAGRVNSVVVLTDGQGGDKAGDIALDDLLNKLGQARSEERPVQVIVVGIGDAVDRRPLTEITRTTGGGVFIAEDPAEIGAVFLQALSLRTATPR